MSSSLSRFSGWSLSLGEGLTDSTGAQDGTHADGVLDRGRRRLFLFSVIAWRRRRATGSIAAGTWRRRPSFTSIAHHSRVRGADNGGRRDAS
jgi:hypothetical protein